MQNRHNLELSIDEELTGSGKVRNVLDFSLSHRINFVYSHRLLNKNCAVPVISKAESFLFIGNLVTV